MTTRQPSKKELTQRLGHAAKRLEFHRQVFNLAEQMDLDVEIDRARRDINEWLLEIAHLREQALIAGYDYRQLEAQ